MDDGLARFHHIETIPRHGFQIGGIVLEQLHLMLTPFVEDCLCGDLFPETAYPLVLGPVLRENGAEGDDSGNAEGDDDDDNEKAVEEVKAAFAGSALVFAVRGSVHAWILEGL